MQVGDFDRIEDLGEAGIELLVASGVEDLVSLAGSDAGSLQHEMTSANTHLNLAEEVPSIEAIQGWISAARILQEADSADFVIPLTEEVPEDPEFDIGIPEAIPVSAALIVEQKIAVKDVPPMEHFVDDSLLSRPPSMSPAKPAVKVREVAPTVAVPRTKPAADKVEVVERNPVEPLLKNPVHDIRKAVSPGLNEGKKLHSRGYIRGVLHPQPFRVRLGAVISLITLILLPSTFVAGGLILAGYSKWLATIPAALLVFGILYFLYARGLKCRICGQPLFAPKACRRHVKAHHIPVLGYILPTSIHILLFHWSRCIYCGTSIRIKQ